MKRQGRCPDSAGWEVCLMDNLFAQLAGTDLPPLAILLICVAGGMEPPAGLC